jgi:hypothetical protein
MELKWQVDFWLHHHTPTAMVQTHYTLHSDTSTGAITVKSESTVNLTFLWDLQAQLI